MSKPNLLNDILSFSKARLNKTETLITTQEGDLYKETKDEYGRLVQTRIAKGTSPGYLNDLKGDVQIGEILPGLILGSQDVAADLHLLLTHGVTHILNLAYMAENLYFEHFTYKKIDIYDLPETNIRDFFPECFDFINGALSNGGCVLVHCNAGVSRAPSITIGYLMKAKKMTFEEAFSLVKERRPATRPNDGFRKQLEAYHPD